MKTALLTLILLLITIAPTAAQDGNLTADCITDFDATVDYFPQKTEAIDAENLNISYHSHYKLVRVGDAFDGAPAFEYVLVQCGAPAPPAGNFAENAQFIEVPAGKLIALSTTQLPALSLLGLSRPFGGGGQRLLHQHPRSGREESNLARSQRLASARK